MSRLFLSLLLFTGIFSLKAQNWLPVDSGMNNGYNGGITLKVFNNKLIAGGAFSIAGKSKARGSAMFDGNTWSIIDSSVNDLFAVRPFVYFKNRFYGFADDYQHSLFYLMWLDSNFKWRPVPNSEVYIYNSYAKKYNPGGIGVVEVYQNELYVAGHFDKIGNNDKLKHFAKWNGTSWSSVGGFNSDQVTAMCIYNNELYVSGWYDSAGTLPARNIARWNGIGWNTVGSGIDLNNGMGNPAHCMTVFRGELYVGGGLNWAGGKKMVNITRWNGYEYNNVGGGVGITSDSTGWYNDVVTSMTVYGQKLIMGGYFSSGLFENDAATWDGFQWDSLGNGINAGPTCFEIYNNKLYAGGRFGFDPSRDTADKANGVAVLDMIDFSTGVKKISADDALFYPNPAEEIIYLKHSNPSQISLKLFDLTGKEQPMNREDDGDIISINVKGLQTGIYIIRLQKRDEFSFQKIIIR